VVRQARRDDADAIADAHVQAWRVAYRPFFPAAYLDSDEFDRDRRDRWRSWSWQRDGTALFVPVLDGRVVGFAFVGPERTEADDAVTGSGEVYSFYLHGVRPTPPTSWFVRPATPSICVPYIASTDDRSGRAAIVGGAASPGRESHAAASVGRRRSNLPGISQANGPPG
jgi:hypothetical protein